MQNSRHEELIERLGDINPFSHTNVDLGINGQRKINGGKNLEKAF